jgi:UDP-4-amino-4,6-dideoxy-N-acetyl-beta-L-altrosamine transaminase
MTGIPYGAQDITDADVKAVSDALRSEFLTQGPRVAEFEKAFSEYIGAKYSIAVTNGTAALHLAALALGVNNKTRVITTAITFAASANCILYCGGSVEFADIDPATGVIDVNSVRSMLAAKPKGYYSGIITVDFAGYPVNAEEFKKLADQYGLWVIGDACHAPGASFTDSKRVVQKSGNNAYSDLSIFSFHPVKHIATGEGGMITTNNEELYKKLVRLRTHGITKDPSQLEKSDGGWYYEMQDLGFNYRIPDILCALGISQLGRIEDSLRKRERLAARYDEAFRGNSVIRPLTPLASMTASGVKHAYHLYVIRTKERLKLYDLLRANHIFAQVHYIPIYQMPYYRRNGFRDVQCKESDKYYSECLSLPMYPTLSDDQQDTVIKTVLKFTQTL